MTAAWNNGEKVVNVIKKPKLLLLFYGSRNATMTSRSSCVVESETHAGTSIYDKGHVE